MPLQTFRSSLWYTSDLFQTYVRILHILGHNNRDTLSGILICVQLAPKWPSLNQSSTFSDYITKRCNPPLPRNPPQRRILELFRVGDGIAEAALGVETAREQVVEQPGFHLAQLGDDALRLPDGVVGCVENFGDTALF